MDNKFNIRPITPFDATAALKVYAPYVLSTAITFEYEVPTPEDFGERIQRILPHYPWLVCTFNHEIVGYAYAHQHRPKAAYQWSAESTIYIDANFHRLGIARILYDTIFKILKLQGFVNVFAGVVVPNINSEEFHKSFGFSEIGVFKKIGYKFNTWHDTKWFQLPLWDHPEAPQFPLTLKEVESMDDFKEILIAANLKIAETKLNR